ncbi:SpoIIE family protein phosphatase [Streptomyces sp. MS06]|uniref:ATP-binding SpoIIE family protein phosphatase n=1 Tax=Streptomyces sp. MS06 TaxID=3385974 RepID=UPI0039A2F77E
MTSGSVDDSTVMNALFGNSPQGLFVFGADRKVVRFNPAGRGVQGLADVDVVGHGVEDFAPGFDAAQLNGMIDEVLATGRPLRGRLVRGRSPSDPRRTLALRISLFPLDGPMSGLVAVVEDVAEQQAAADRLAVLGAVHENVGSSLDAAATGSEVVHALVPAFADAASVDLLDEGPDGGRPAGVPPVDAPLRRIAVAPAGFRTIRRLGESVPCPYPTPFTQVRNDLQARVVSVSADAPWVAADPAAFAPLFEERVHSMIVAPLRARETTLGLLTLYRHRPEPFDEADLDVAKQVASTASAHLDNARSYRREHTIASTLQRRLQPGTVPRLSAVETAHVYLPESAGGDWFDVIPLSGTRVALVVGEVSGHGIEAAATTGQLRVALRTLAMQDLETDELLTRLDEVATELGGTRRRPGSHVATCAVTVYNPVARLCAMVRAGHPAPIVLDPDGSPVPVDVPEGPPLGEGGGHAYTPVVTPLSPGSLIALYSDGLLATRRDPNAARRCLEKVLAPASRPLQEVCDTAVYRMAPSRKDDAVLLLARTRALPPEDVADWTLPTDASIVSTARRLVDRQLAAWRLDDAAFTAELVVSELVTNAIRYGAGPIRLRLIHDSGRLICEVADANSSSPYVRHARENEEGGRGLYIVMRLSSRWGVRHTRQGKTIWAEQRLDQAGPGPGVGAQAYGGAVPDPTG